MPEMMPEMTSRTNDDLTREEYRHRFEAILEQIEKPVRYIGGEWNSVVKDHADVAVTMALAYPDLYEIGMSHLGYRILYSLLNDRPDVAAERVFCPWPDMREALQRDGLPLATLESDTPLGRFDVVGFSLQYEMTFTNILTMLDLGGIPLRSADRVQGRDPLVIAGGPVVFNSEPIADFFDCILLGDAEEMLPELLDRYRELRDGGADRGAVLRELAKIAGVYVPSLYETELDPATGLVVAVPTGDAPFPVRRRLILDIDTHPFPSKIVVPYGEIVHDRISMEIMRGCPVGCRFCQAGYIYRPTREREPGEIKKTVERSVKETGYDEFSLSSLNTGEFGAIQPMITSMMDEFEPERVALSLGSLHATTLTAELAEQIKRVRKTGFTIAPEGGTQRMRDVINKNLSEEQILDAARHAYTAGWEDMKLYFMIGQPTETDADVEGIVDLSRRIIEEGKRIRGKRVEAALSASSFVPKAHTPFQWCGMDRIENLYRKQGLIRSLVPRGIRFKYHKVEVTFMEGVLSRGDRRLSAVIERAWRKGCHFDGWTEFYRHDFWMEAFAEEGIDPEPYAYNDIDTRARLPWDVTDALVNKLWLATEWRRAIRGEAGHTLSICGPDDCHGCAPFARDCVSGIVSKTTGRPMPQVTAPVAPPEGPAPTFRYRARFSKEGRLRFLSHLDLTRAVIRSYRRAGIPLSYSQGFHPMPLIAFGPALPVGVSSGDEYLDFESRAEIGEKEFLDLMEVATPEGLRFLGLRPLERGEDSLQVAINVARYVVELPRERLTAAEGAPGLEAGAVMPSGRAAGGVGGVGSGAGEIPAETRLPELLVRRLDEATQAGGLRIVRQRKGKTQELTIDPQTVEVSAGPGGSAIVTLTLGTGATVRPAELMELCLGDEGRRASIRREALLIERDGTRFSPLASPLSASAAQAAAGDAR